MKQSTFSAVMANNLLTVLQGYTKSIRLLLVMFLTLTVSAEVWGATTTYTFTSKSWADTSNGWTSGKDGNALTSNQGVQVTTGVTGANATTKNSFTNISSIVVQYCTNASKGAGSIKIQVGSNTEKTFSVTKPSSGGTTLKTATFTFDPNETGKVKITVSCTTNSVYIYSVAITTADAVTCTTPPTVSAGSHSDVTTTTATVSCSGGITSLGSAGCSIESYGFVYGTSSNPTISNTKVQVGTTYTTTGTAFSKELTGLTANTTYYVRPYATNGNGTAYGTQTSFKTLELPKYTVTLVPGSGSVTDTELEEESAGAGVELPTPTLDCGDWEFAGWKTTSAVATETTTQPTLIAAGAYSPTSDITLYAVYQRTEETEGTPTTTNKTYTHTITAKTWSANGAQTLNSVSWTLDNNGNYYGYDGTKGQQVGSGNDPAKSMTLTTSGFANATKITAVRISTSGASSINSTVSVKVGSTFYTYDSATTAKLTTSNTQYEFTGSTTGDVTISWSQTSSKAIYFKTIEVDYQTTTGGGTTTTTYYHSTPECSTETTVYLILKIGIFQKAIFGVSLG